MWNKTFWNFRAKIQKFENTPCQMEEAAKKEQERTGNPFAGLYLVCYCVRCKAKRGAM